jgi:hypothetical protein
VVEFKFHTVEVVGSNPAAPTISKTPGVSLFEASENGRHRPENMQIEFLVPLSFKPDEINRQDHRLLVTGRLKPGISLAAAEADLQVIAAGIARDYPATNQNWGVHVTPLRNY